MSENPSSRRNFLRRFGIAGSLPFLMSPVSALGANPASRHTSGKAKFEIGIASWGLRKLSFEELIPAMKDMQLRNISLKSMHLPFDLSDEELKSRVERMRSEGLNPYAPGVVYMNTKEEADRAFEYTRAAGMNMIVGVPAYEVLDYVEEKIKEYDIRVAIHCHGPDNLPYPSAEDAWNRIKNRDRRLGICVDIAHVIRGGLDPVEQIKRVQERIMDAHIWDVSEAAKAGQAVRPGKGVMNFEEVLGALIGIGYDGSLSIEYGSEAENPVPACLETKGYINGVLSVI